MDVPANEKGPAKTGPSSLLSVHRSRGPGLGLELGQTALLPGRGVGMDQMLPACAIEELLRLGEGRLELGPRRSTHLFERAAKAAALGAVLRGMDAGLTHALLGGFDSGHGNLG